MRNLICELITSVASGETVLEYKKIIFCEEKRCTRSEFYAAYGVGLCPKIILEISPIDYNNQVVKTEQEIVFPQQVKYKQNVYNILRTYNKNNLSMELTIG